mmetsp:Transcript_5657/g.16150  ORF Transcript_5657/g.16150 Transcript_5657/m.16150 type:complete len:185 (-) Transcript_5657:412-966(-)
MSQPASKPPVDIDKLIEKTEEQLSRLQALESGQVRTGTFVQRAARHIGKHGSVLANVALAGAVFAVSLSQLQQKHNFEYEIARREEQLDNAGAEKQRLRGQLAALEHDQERLREAVLQELDHGGMRLAPTAEKIRKLLGHPVGGGDGPPPPRPLMPVPLPSQQELTGQTPPPPSKAGTQSRYMI